MPEGLSMTKDCLAVPLLRFSLPLPTIDFGFLVVSPDTLGVGGVGMGAGGLIILGLGARHIS